MKIILIGAGSDLGVHVNGAKFGPDKLLNNINDCDIEKISIMQDESIIKSKDKNDMRKNEYEVDKYNTNLYNTILDKINQEYFPILIGGDHSIVVASALASSKKHDNIGMIWIDAHTDYNTFRTTKTGNIHGLPLAAITGYENEELRKFHNGNIIKPENTVVVGARSIDELEKINVLDSGITVFTTEDIKNQGVEKIMEKAFTIASKNTNGVHISYDLDVISPSFAPGVSIPEINGINLVEATKINYFILNNLDKVLSYDLVELNPLKDIDEKTEKISLNLLNKIIEEIKKR